tara:strand:+ start:3798 stop:4202 length:405 start_codon:yes stop_codon:yes gene_type:complete
MSDNYDTIPEDELCSIMSDLDCEDAEIFDMQLVKLDEDVEIPFDTKQYLPKGFNPLKGMHDLDWNTIELVTLDEEDATPFDTKEYLPEGFNPLKGLHDIDWNTIGLFEIEEDVELNFNTKDYLPENFCPYESMC